MDDGPTGPYAVVHEVHGYLAHIQRDGALYAAVFEDRKEALAVRDRLNSTSRRLYESGKSEYDL
ncbi:hypothetical protein [Streptomyces clavuligerus]|uniref:hypothetical protein n=1 Tax=Streptomyces clavuligerus TaxID=1901 RepID=UPI001013D320|nr:hypothetical protein [Streptomyces clavuligerus]MBY6306438.1 hypothetical protein [Streptomyces clavuligerus]QPJ91607.1 hypothetical protein GE265_00455 [Streptomyces clavuligerus]QPL66263.1 hypothetical protein I3J04_27630 [Streptomyces clavuligerus]QPL71632.1 hypothetical protein I3J05_23925 [Streptomyces clavuligerus]QPL78375.1 hypothetical protein I3J06_27645 [Streptomyces clavuligerus]